MCDDLVRGGAVADEVAEEDVVVDLPFLDGFEDRLEGFHVAVDVREDQVAHVRSSLCSDRLVQPAGLVGAPDERPGDDLPEPRPAGRRGEAREFVGRVVLRDRRMGRRRLEVLSDGQKVAAGLPQVVEGPEDVGLAFAETDHEARLGQGAPRLRRRQDAERPAVVLPGTADGRIERLRRLQVVVEDLRPGGEDRLQRRRVPAEIGDEGLDPRSGALRRGWPG